MCSTLSRREGGWGTNVCYASRKSSFSTPQNVPLFPYYAHADNNSRLAIAVTTLSSPSLIDKPATVLHGQRVFIMMFKGPGTHIFLYILNASKLSSNTFNDIRRKPNSRKPYVISQCISSVPKPRPRYLAFNAIPTAASESRSGGGLKLRLMCPKNSPLSEFLSSTTRKKTVFLSIDSTVFCKNCSVRVGERSSMNEKRWTSGSPHRSKNSLSSVEA